MNYGKIIYCDIANGIGCRTSLFVSGCRRRCPGCFNKAAWDFGYGELFTADTEDAVLRSLKPCYINGLTILGGEPLAKENRIVVQALVSRVKREMPSKTIWVYTGYEYERLPIDAAPILRYIDVLVDGPFIEAQKDISLKFRGSANQRIISIPKTARSGTVVEAVI